MQLILILKLGFFAILSFFLPFCELKPQHVITKVLDLTHPFDNDTIYWPTELNRFKFIGRTSVQTANYHYVANSFSAAEHGGTHIDAPRHFYSGGRSVAEIPMANLVGKGIVVNVEAQASQDKDYLVNVKDFEAWEAEHGTIESNSIVLINTGWGKKWPNATLYLGTSTTNVSLLHFPGLSADGASWLIDNRKVSAVGLDTASTDYGQSTDFKTHVALSSRNIPGFENVANLHLLPPKDFLVFALPMKIADGSGGPLRIVAVMGEITSASNGPLKSFSLLPLLTVLLATYLQYAT